MKRIFIPLLLFVFLAACNQQDGAMKKDNLSKISVEIQDKAFTELGKLYPDADSDRIQKGVSQVAAFWQASDGGEQEFIDFCIENYVEEGPGRELLFQRLSENFEVLWGSFNKISLKLKEPVHLDIGEILPVDRKFAGYAAGSHLDSDLFENKIAFIVLLNFPFQNLQEKNIEGKAWSRLDWAYARMGEIFTSRVPAELKQEYSRVNSAADAYISDYNIYMGQLRNAESGPLFPEDLRLITHWGLRDELKSNYAIGDGLAKQEMIYEVMLDIIHQRVPVSVINSPDLLWDPYVDKVFTDDEWKESEAEPDTRYEHMVAQYRALKAMDEYHPLYPTYISRKFDQDMEMPQQEVEKLFVELISSPVVAKTAEIIRERLGRDLQPFDIWYDGFKARSNIDEQKLDSITRAKYPDVEAFQSDLPNILVALGFDVQDAVSISNQVVVDPSRGAGHAWGASMRSEPAHLRTRIGKDGMDYKGYNIAIHEFGHNVEQTISLQDVDHYILNGVPNTAFTEALAFVFQKKDLELLGMEQNDPKAEAMSVLDHLWSNYEIMGVSLVDMRVWKWLYEQDDVTAEQLKAKVIEIATDVWNTYYAPVFGVEDSPILAIYSHMIDYPLYLSAYPIGELIQFQVEEHLNDVDFAAEVQRIYSLGRLTPNQWMQEAVGTPISIEPIVSAAEAAVTEVSQQ